jgi:hypothetical protein
MGIPRETHPGESAVAPRSEQAEGVPSVPPGAADPVVRVEDHEREPSFLQVVPDREAGLAAADDDGLESLEHGFLVEGMSRNRDARGAQSSGGIGSSPQTRPCSMANSVAAARVDTPIFA